MDIVIEQLVTLNGSIQVPGPYGDYEIDERGWPWFKKPVPDGWVVQVITISLGPRPRRVFVSRKGVLEEIEE